MSVEAPQRIAATSMVCSGCGYEPPPSETRPFRCPNQGSDDTDHVIRRVLRKADADLRGAFIHAEPDPFIRYRQLMHVWQTAMALGVSDAEYVELVQHLGRRIKAIGGVDFRVTPFVSSDKIWFKDETRNVAGSHKGRHLMGLMLWIELMKRFDPRLAAPRLAIASCGNAALAAAVIARAARRPLDVFVPADASSDVTRDLEELGARVTRCQRIAGELGDPAYLRFREAVAAGALPFTCQGNENGMAIEGGQTIGWEIVSQLLLTGDTFGRLFVQVGGGALATACIAAFEDAHTLGLISRMPRIHAVQTKAAHPLVRAWELMKLRHAQLEDAVHHRSQFMRPWAVVPRSVATGILDDETYDWAAVIRGMSASGGYPIVVNEEQLIKANDLARNSSGIAVSPTGSAGFAGYLALRQNGAVRSSESVAVLFTGRM